MKQRYWDEYTFEDRIRLENRGDIWHPEDLDEFSLSELEDIPPLMNIPPPMI